MFDIRDHGGSYGGGSVKDPFWKSGYTKPPSELLLGTGVSPLNVQYDENTKSVFVFSSLALYKYAIVNGSYQSTASLGFNLGTHRFVPLKNSNVLVNFSTNGESASVAFLSKTNFGLLNKVVDRPQAIFSMRRMFESPDGKYLFLLGISGDIPTMYKYDLTSNPIAEVESVLYSQRLNPSTVIDLFGDQVFIRKVESGTNKVTLSLLDRNTGKVTKDFLNVNESFSPISSYYKPLALIDDSVFHITSDAKTLFKRKASDLTIVSTTLFSSFPGLGNSLMDYFWTYKGIIGIHNNTYGGYLFIDKDLNMKSTSLGGTGALPQQNYSFFDTNRLMTILYNSASNFDIYMLRMYPTDTK